MPTLIQATFPVRGEGDYDALFGYLHQLLEQEGTETGYVASSTSVQLATLLDASDRSSEVARRFREQIELDALTLPALKDPSRSAAAGSLAVELLASSLAWLRSQRDAWQTAGGSPGTFHATRALKRPKRRWFGQLLRALHWLATSPPGTAGNLVLCWVQAGALEEVLWRPAAVPAPCPSCRADHAGDLCGELLRTVRPGELRSIAFEDGGREQAFAVGESDPPELSIETPDLDAIEPELDRFHSLEQTDWDLAPEAIAALPPAPDPLVAVEVDFDQDTQRVEVLKRVEEMADAEGAAFNQPGERGAEVGHGLLTIRGDDPWISKWLVKLELTLGQPFAPRPRGSRPIQAYAEPTYYLLFKALHWLSANVGQAQTLSVELVEPEERFDITLSGPREACGLCASEHAPGACVDLVAQASPRRVARLSLAPGGALARLEVDVRAKEVRAFGDRASLIGPLLGWTGIERISWDPGSS